MKQPRDIEGRSITESSFFYKCSADKTKGPFLAHEVAVMAKRGVLLADTTVVDKQGRSLPIGQLEKIAIYEERKTRSEVIPPPPLPSCNDNAVPEEPRVFSRRLVLVVVAIAATNAVMRSCRNAPPKGPPQSQIRRHSSNEKR